MQTAPSPAFQFYVKDWRSSRKVQRMNFATRGMYLEMLLEEWEHGSLPASPEHLATLLGGTKAEWSRAWPKLITCFVARPRDGRLINQRLERVRRERLKFKKAQAESGLRGAERRWKKHGKPIGSPSKPNGVVMANDGSSSSSSSSTSSVEQKATAALAKRSPLVFEGQRVKVYDWQERDLKRLLGPLVKAFNLGDWFRTLDARAVGAACAIPQRDGGQWLQAQTLAEVQRRGLPIAVASPITTAGKQTQRLEATLANIAARERA